MSVHLVSPSDNSFSTAPITPRWLFFLAAATTREAGDPILVDESLEQILPESIQPGDIVGIRVYTGNALRGYAVGKMARSRGAWVVYGGIHATLFSEEALERNLCLQPRSGCINEVLKERGFSYARRCKTRPQCAA